MCTYIRLYIDGLVQERHNSSALDGLVQGTVNSIANVLELRFHALTHRYVINYSCNIHGIG